MYYSIWNHYPVFVVLIYADKWNRNVILRCNIISDLGDV